jgi:hypothetical protein
LLSLSLTLQTFIYHEIAFYSIQNELAFPMVENTDKSCSLKSPINLNSEDSADIETHVQGMYSALR